MARYRDNALRKEDSGMATPVHDIASVTATAKKQQEMNSASTPVISASNHRSMAPLVILGFLIFFFFVSPLLPIGVREYISALVR